MIPIPAGTVRPSEFHEGDVLAVADTYNDRIKFVDPATAHIPGWPGRRT